ncbi:MAG: fatty acyl-AMP ligase [Deltaproteobacteria bacterium]|jgi:acyl-CoA synthetase (AMP-forming)/AMP-acid ligase II|nr:fatty acyl-AMP ligase [Deltaproteobacteria bacterium]
MNNQNHSLTAHTGAPAGLFHPDLTLCELARKRARLHPDRLYVTFLEDGENVERSSTYSELDQSAERVAGWLQSQGLTKGDRAMIMLPNGLEFVQILYGCFYAGVVAVPQPQQLQAYLKTFLPTIYSARPKLLIASPAIVEFIKHRCPEELQEVFAPITVISATELLQSQQSGFDPPDIQKQDIAYLQYTSGSTGTPKGVMISHRNVLANMEQAGIFGDWEEGKGTSLWLPLFHDFGLAAGLLGAMVNGGFVILMTPAHFMVKPLRWLQSISKYRCAYSYAPPFGYDLCIRKIPTQEKQHLDLSCLISSVYGAEPVHFGSVKRFNEYFSDCGLSQTAIRPGFGMAETVIMFTESSHLNAICVHRQKLESKGHFKLIDETAPLDQKKFLVNLGPAMHGHEIVIKGPENTSLPEGSVGEILLSGPSVCEGYFDNIEATEETFRQRIQGKQNPFLATGDLGLIWEGNLYFVGRKKDIIIIRGKNYYPQDIEYAIPLGKEIRPECVMAFADASGSGNDKLTLAMEIEGGLLPDQEMLYKYVIPAIDNRIVSELGKQLQIYPDVRLYLKPGSLSKTSSGKLKHRENRAQLIKPEVKGLICRVPDLPEYDIETTETGELVVKLFRQIVGVKPDLNGTLYQLSGNKERIQRFVETLQEIYPLSDQELTDWINERTTLDELIDWLDEQLWSGMVPI